MDKTLEKSNKGTIVKSFARQPDHHIRAILFDLDGVLVDAADWHKEAFDKALATFNHDPLDEKDHLENFNGLSTYRKLDLLVGRGIWKFKEHEIRTWFYSEKQAITEQIINEKCKPVTRVIDTVEYARTAFDGKIGVVTNCSRKTAELMLEKSKLKDKFKIVITNEDVDGKIKPHPWPYIKAAWALDVYKMKNVLAIDDTGKGIMSAINAGCRTWLLEEFESLSVRNLMCNIESFRIAI